MMQPPTLVIGIGNVFRSDDGVGAAVLRLLRMTCKDASCELVEATGDATQLMELWRERRQVIVVDAIRSGARPGTVSVIDLLMNELPGADIPSTHAASVASAVAWSRQLQRLPNALQLVGVEGAEFALGNELSPRVAAALPEAARMVEALLASIRARGSGTPAAALAVAERSSHQ